MNVLAAIFFFKGGKPASECAVLLAAFLLFTLPRQAAAQSACPQVPQNFTFRATGWPRAYIFAG